MTNVIAVEQVQVGDTVRSPFGHHDLKVVEINPGMYGLLEIVGTLDGDRHLLSLDPAEDITRIAERTPEEARLAEARAAVSDANAALTAALGTEDEEDARAALRTAEQRVMILSASSVMLVDASTGTVLR
jgi:hypothetical protein